MPSRRSRLSFRPMLDTLPSRLTPGNYPAIGPMPADPMGTDTPTWATPTQILEQPGTTGNGGLVAPSYVTTGLQATSPSSAAVAVS